jgi:hypothetical protein
MDEGDISLQIPLPFGQPEVEQYTRRANNTHKLLGDVIPTFPNIYPSEHPLDLASCIQPQSVFVLSVGSQKQTAIISLNNINRFIVLLL